MIKGGVALMVAYIRSLKDRRSEQLQNLERRPNLEVLFGTV